MYVTFRVVIEYDSEANSYSAVCPELPGCASAGHTEEAARRNIEEAIRLYLEPDEEKAMELKREPVGGHERAVTGFDARPR